MNAIKQYALIGAAIVGFGIVNKVIIQPRAEAAIAEEYGIEETGMEIYHSCKVMMTDKEFTTGGTTNSNCGCIAGAASEKLESPVRFAFAKHLESAKYDDAEEVMSTLIQSITSDATPEGFTMMMALTHSLDTCLKSDDS